MFSIKAKRQQRELANGSVAFFDWHWLGRNRIVAALLLGIFATIATMQSGLALPNRRTVPHAFAKRCWIGLPQDKFISLKSTPKASTLWKLGLGKGAFMEKSSISYRRPVRRR